MPQHISELRGRLLEAVDEVWGESLLLAFLKNGVSDPDRENATIEAPFRVGGEDTPKAGAGVGWSSRIASGMAEMRPNAEKWPAAALIRQNDKVRTMDRPNQGWWEVVTVDDRAAPRLIVKLRQA